MPGPVSVTLSSSPSLVRSAATVTVPDVVNFDALEIRLMSTCSSRSKSPSSSGRSGAMASTTVTPLPENSALVASMARVTSADGATGAIFHSMRPASIFEMSSTSLMSAVSRSPSETMMSMFPEICSAAFRAFRSPSGTVGKIDCSSLFFVILAKPSTDVSGVRSSCETVAMKSVFMRSTSFSRVTSRTMTTAPMHSSSA
jgi:hypothetical protein